MAAAGPYPLTSPRPDPGLAHRTASATVEVRDGHGQPLSGTEVVVEQVEHAFGFGCIGFELLPPEAPRLPRQVDDPGTDHPDHAAMAAQWLELFNTATLPFYWGQFEPHEGAPQTDRLRDGARWFADRGVRLKGHPLTWHTLAPPWLLGRDLPEVERLLRERITREVAGLAGLVDTWDAINEVVIMPVFTAEDNAITPLARRLGRIGITRLAFETARAANPSATLLLNDFDLSTAYDTLVEGVLEAGVQVDALGLQSHMHQGWWGEERTLEILERFSRYGLPLHLTETTLVSGDLMPAHVEDLNDHVVEPGGWPSTPEGEARQAEELERHYRLVLSHPSVESITWWGLWDRYAWLHAPAGLVRDDGTPKPAYETLRRLVKEEWWLSPTTVRTDAGGRLPLTGWLGRYAVRLPDGRAAEVELTRDAHHLTAQVATPVPA
jgi:endo-1,4-beta-xylanase